jgi:hypothetical protein
MITTRVSRARAFGLNPWRETLLFISAYLVYECLRWMWTGTESEAIANGERLWEMQLSMGIAIEQELQRALNGTWALTGLSWIYVFAQSVALPLAVVLSFMLAPRVYRRLRSTLIATWLLALPIYALLPVAPPRLSDMGVDDSVSQLTGVALDSPSLLAFYNPYAAVPSLHAGFAVAIGAAVFLTAKRLWVKVAGLLWAPLVMLATFATGNHFVLDAVAGVAVVAVGLVAGIAFERVWKAARGESPGPGPRIGESSP